MKARKLIEIPWLYRAATWQIAIVSLASGLMVFALAFGLEIWSLRRGSPVRAVVVAPTALAGLLTATLQFATIQFGRRRRRFIMERLAHIGELNHHVRNALEVISSAAMLGGTDPKYFAVISQSVQRITWALNEIRGKFPDA